jgi:hypothetical protein
MRILLACLAATVAGLAPPADAQGCPIAGITTLDVGTGTGFLAPAELALAFDAATCTVQVQIDAPACCNTFLSQHLVALGNALSPNPISLRGIFLPGSEAHLVPIQLLGPFGGGASSIAVPPNPALVGQSFVLQGVPVFFTTIGFDFDFGVTQAVVLSFF